MTAYPQPALYIDGMFETDRAGEPVVNPATEETLAQLPHASPADLDRALAAAARGFEEWRRVSAYERARFLRRAADLIRERAPAIAHALTLECGKPLREAQGEMAYAADVIEWYAEEGRRAYGRVIPSRDPALRLMVLSQPVGPAVAFTPWNFPAITPARKIGGALAAGCSLILKAAELTPATAVELVRAFHDAGLPKGVLNLVFGKPAAISEHLLKSPIPRKVSFTGSIPVGKHLIKLAAETVTRTTMELGGSAPVIVFEDADPAAAAKIAAAGKFRNAGQVCVSPTRFFVHKKNYDRFVDTFAQTAAALRLGDGLEAETEMGPLITEKRIEVMDRFVEDASRRGGEIVTGGGRSRNKGYFYKPTVLTGVPDDSLLMTEEPFGPLAPIVPFSEFDEVVDRANALPFGLASYVFTPSTAKAQAASSALNSGLVGINTLTISQPETPFGGIKESGWGQEGGQEGLTAYLDVKLVSQA